MCVPGCAGTVMSCINKVIRLGGSTDSCGTPLGKRLFVADVPLLTV